MLYYDAILGSGNYFFSLNIWSFKIGDGYNVHITSI